MVNGINAVKNVHYLTMITDVFHIVQLVLSIHLYISVKHGEEFIIYLRKMENTIHVSSSTSPAVPLQSAEVALKSMKREDGPTTQ